MLRLSAELTCCDSLILVLSEGGWGCESETYLVYSHLFTYNIFLARRNQSQLAAPAIYHIPPLITERIQEHATFSPRDFCGGAGASFTGKIIFGSEHATSRCCRALTQNATSSLLRCWGWRCCTGNKAGKNGAGAMTAIKSKGAHVKWGRHAYATPGGI